MARKQYVPSAAEVVAARINATMKEDVVTLGSDTKYEIERVPTGILTIDRLLHGGFARGRHVELFGDWLTGKSLVMYSTMALAQERGEVCALVDAENVFSARWFKRLGGNPNDLIMAEAKNAHTLGNVIRVMIQKGDFDGVDIIGIDSVASLLPKEEEEHDLDESLQPANLARLMSVLLRQLTMQNENSIFIWTNQWRDKISKLPLPPSTPGGRALGFYASTRLELREAEKETVEIDTVSRGTVAKRKSVTGRWVNVTVRKEKTGARPESSGSFLLDYERKVPLVSQELIDLGMQDGLIERHGNIYTVVGYDGKVTANGIKQMRTKIEKDEKLEDWLRTCVEERTAELDEGDG